MRDAAALNTSQEAGEKPGNSVLSSTEKIQVWLTLARNMSQGRGLDLDNVVCHVPGRDASLRRMYASHSVSMEALADSRSEKFAIAIAQCQWTKGVWRSNNLSIIIDVRGLGDKDS